MNNRNEQKSKKYSADMYKYDDGIDPKDLLQNKEKPTGKARLFHDWIENIIEKR